MIQTEWIKQFHRTKEEFRWFIDEYYPGVFEVIEILVNSEKLINAYSIMNDIWFNLPDSKFNIIENPKSWNAFLALLEEPPYENT